MSRYIDVSNLDIPSDENDYDELVAFADKIAEMIVDAPSIEPNLILPERMERGDIYEVGETIVVMNHDDYYDLLCKSIEPKSGEWIAKTENYHSHWVCSECGGWALLEYNEQMCLSNFCPNCGADMRKENE